jgi:hypothetical protein
VIGSGKIRWLGHVVRVREVRKAYRTLAGKLEGKNNFEDIG